MKCAECGLPRGIGNGNVWKSSGVIVGKRSQDIRAILCDVSELDYLYSRLSEYIGYDVTRLVTEAKRKDHLYFTRNLLKHLEEKGVKPDAESFFRTLASFYPLTGFGKANIVDVQEGLSVDLEAEEIYNLPMCQGQIAGAFEAVFMRRAVVSWTGDAHKGKVKVEAVGEESEMGERMEQEVEVSSPLLDKGDRKYELCSGCGAPLELSQDFEWNIDKAQIKERRSRKRFIFDNAKGIVAVMRVLSEELGEEVELTMEGILRDYSRGYYRFLKDSTSMEEELARFPLWGLGLVQMLDQGKGSYRFQVINPVYPTLVAGRLWGMLETLESKEFQLEMKAEEIGITELTFSS